MQILNGRLESEAWKDVSTAYCTTMAFESSLSKKLRRTDVYDRELGGNRNRRGLVRGAKVKLLDLCLAIHSYITHTM